MRIGDKVIITKTGNTEAELNAYFVRCSVHPVTRDFQREACGYEKGDEGVILDISASGKFIVLSKGKERHIDIDSLEVEGGTA